MAILQEKNPQVATVAREIRLDVLNSKENIESLNTGSIVLEKDRNIEQSINNSLRVKREERDRDNVRKESRLINYISNSLLYKEKNTKEKKTVSLNRSKEHNLVEPTIIENLPLLVESAKIFNGKVSTYLNLNKKRNKGLTSAEQLVFSLNKESGKEKEFLYLLNLRINKYLFILNKFYLGINFKTYIWNITLYLPKRIFKPQPLVKITYKMRKFFKTSVFKIQPNSAFSPFNIEIKRNQAPSTLQEKGLILENVKGNTKNNLVPGSLTGEGGEKIFYSLLKEGLILFIYLNILILNKRSDINSNCKQNLLSNAQADTSDNQSILLPLGEREIEKILSFHSDPSAPLQGRGKEINSELLWNIIKNPTKLDFLIKQIKQSEEREYLNITNESVKKNKEEKLSLVPSWKGSEKKGELIREIAVERERKLLMFEAWDKKWNLKNKYYKKKDSILPYLQSLISIYKDLPFKAEAENLKINSSQSKFKNLILESLPEVKTGIAVSIQEKVEKDSIKDLAFSPESGNGEGEIKKVLVSSEPVQVLEQKELKKNNKALYTLLDPFCQSKTPASNPSFDLTLGLSQGRERKGEILTEKANNNLNFTSLIQDKQEFEAPKLEMLPFSLSYYHSPLTLSDTNSPLSLCSLTSPNNPNNPVKKNLLGYGVAQDMEKDLVKKPVLSHYLKEISIYNMKKKGVFMFYYTLIGFNFNKNNNNFFTTGNYIYKLLAASFKSMYCLISKPVFISTPDKLIVQLFYFLFIPNLLRFTKFFKINTTSPFSTQTGGARGQKNLKKKSRNNAIAYWIKPRQIKGQLKDSKSIRTFNKKNELLKRIKKKKKQFSKFRKIKLSVRVKLRKLSKLSLIKVYPEKFKLLSLILNNIFKKPVEFDLIRLHYPYKDSNILVNLLGIMVKKIKLRMIIRRLFENAIIKSLKNLSLNKTIIPAFLSGITIRVAGRLLTQRVVPKKTVYAINRGASATGKINFKDVATFKNKNKRGAFSITVKSGHNFF